MSKLRSSGGIKANLQEYGYFYAVIAMAVSTLLCILQFILNLDNMILLAIALTIFGLALAVTALWTFPVEGIFHIGFLLMLIVGGAMLVLAYFLVFERDSTISQLVRSLPGYEVAALEKDELEIYLDIDPKEYHTSEAGTIQISIENLSNYTLVLDSVIFETRGQFFDGFSVDYESADPPIKDRKERIINTIALYFSEEEMIISPGENYIVKVEIIANQPGDYSDNFYVFPEFDLLESEALGELIFHEEIIDLVILPGD